MKKLLGNERGIAFMMVIFAIVVLTTLMAEFSFESNINKLKAYNIQDKTQARLNAEAGLNFAMIRLNLYQEAYNKLLKNEEAKKLITQEFLNKIWNFPFAYPIPITKDMSGTEKEMIKDFEKSSVIDGEILLTIENISQKLNLNLLRVKSFFTSEKEYEKAEQSDKGEENEFDIKTQIKNSLMLVLENKRDTDLDFYNKYANLNYDELIKKLTQYITDPISEDFEAEIDGEDGSILYPKEAPFSSWSELYMIPDWTDELIDTLKNEYTVRGAVYLDLNKITENMLRIIIPSINDEEVKNFFEYRDDPDEPKFFNSLQDFKNYVVKKANILTEAHFDERFAKYKEEGIIFDVAPTIFKVTATGIKERANYKLIAYVSIPEEPRSIRVKPQSNENENESENENENQNPDENKEGDNNEAPPPTPPEGEQKPQPLLAPRVIEMFIE